MRWATATKREITTTLADLGGSLASTEVGGDTFCHAGRPPLERPRPLVSEPTASSS